MADRVARGDSAWERRFVALALIFLLVAIITGLLGFTVMACPIAAIARAAVVLLLTLFLISLALQPGLLR